MTSQAVSLWCAGIVWVLGLASLINNFKEWSKFWRWTYIILLSAILIVFVVIFSLAVL